MELTNIKKSGQYYLMFSIVISLLFLYFYYSYSFSEKNIPIYINKSLNDITIHQLYSDCNTMTNMLKGYIGLSKNINYLFLFVLPRDNITNTIHIVNCSDYLYSLYFNNIPLEVRGEKNVSIYSYSNVCNLTYKIGKEIKEYIFYCDNPLYTYYVNDSGIIYDK